MGQSVGHRSSERSSSHLGLFFLHFTRARDVDVPNGEPPPRGRADFVKGEGPAHVPLPARREPALKAVTPFTLTARGPQ